MVTRGASRKWTPKRQRERARRSDSEQWAQRLAELDAIRRPFDLCVSQVIERVERVLPSEGRLIEVGAGSGQLRQWLRSTRPRFTHTEPARDACQGFREKHPEASFAQASAAALPFDDGSCAAVVGLCVFDLLDDLDGALREAKRVLSGDGVIVHLLDLSPTPRAHFADLHAAERIPLPNLFSDPSASEWPNDLLVTERKPMLDLLRAIKREGHPLPTVFKRFFDELAGREFDAHRAVRAYDAVARTPQARQLLQASLLSAYQAGHRLRLPPPRGTPASGALHLAQRLDAAAKRVGLSVSSNEMCFAWTHRADKDDTEPRYRSLVAGQERRLDELPEKTLCSDAVAPSEREQLVEVGVHLWVARRAEI